MSMPLLVWRNLLHRKALTLLTVMSIALTVALLVFLMLLSNGVEQGAEKGYGPFEVVVGADGSETQLALNTFYHVGAPTGNIPFHVFESLRNEPETDAAFAITAGDSYNGYPIVGIDPEYFQIRYGDKRLASGNLYAATGEAVIGSYAAQATGIRVGDTFSGAHGLVQEHHDEAGEEAGEEHDEHEAHEEFSYKVVGILPALHTPDDRAVFTTMDYAWAVHHTESAESKDVTAIMVKPKSLLGVQSLKAKYDAMDHVQAVYASKAVADVVNMVDQGAQAAGAITALCVVLAAITLALSLIAAASERKRDVGLLRLIGKSRLFVWAALMGEGMLLTAAGLVVGVLVGHIGGFLSVDAVFGYAGIRLAPWSLAPGEGILLAGALLIGAAATLAPALGMYRVDPLRLFRS
ncbi:MAG: transporter permease [Paenibacillaceae bacterium]|jgi:putative ABC transport system permease protein|nr:transporter permease [Paenibacillaceae bacterium]